MDHTVVGLFDTFSQAQTAVQQLVDAGFQRDHISLVANDASGQYANYNASGDKVKNAAGAGAVGGTAVGGLAGLLVGLGALTIPGIGPVLAAGPLLGVAALGAGVGAATGSLLNGMVAAGIPKEEAQYYAEGVRRGGTLVTVVATDATAQQASQILNTNHAADVEERGASWRQSGWTGWSETEKPYTADQIKQFSTTTTTTTAKPTVVSGDAKMVLPVVEEQLKVGKRAVESGGVRVYSRVTERPVEEQVTLHEEHVTVERHPVDRAVTAADAAFKEQSIELTEHSEEAIVSKTVRVIEEVIVGKEGSDHVETVRDTVRRTDVDVQQVAGTQTTGPVTSTTTAKTTSTGGFDTYNDYFRTNYDSKYNKSGYTYEQYSPVYRYGYDLGTDKRYNTGDWSTVEQQARTRWEERNPNTWDQFRDAIHYAWDKARGATK